MDRQDEKIIERDIDAEMSLLQHMGQIAEKYGRTEILQDIENRLQTYLSLYYLQ